MKPAPSPEPVTTFAVHVTEWKRAFLQRYFPEGCFHFLPKDLAEREIAHLWTPTIFAEAHCEFLVWGRNCRRRWRQSRRNGTFR